MIKRTLFISLLLLLAASALFADDKGLFSCHTSFQGVFGLPLKDYSMEAGTGSDEFRQDAVLGGQIGSRWYIFPGKKFAAGIMVNWIDVVQASTPLSSTETFSVLDIGLLETGFTGSLRLADTSALDLYYQARPALLINKIATTAGFIYQTADGYALAREIHRTGLGVGHTLGLAFRYDRYNFGAEFLFGALPHFFNEALMGTEGGIAIHPVMSLYPDLRTECFRVVLGVQL